MMIIDVNALCPIQIYGDHFPEFSYFFFISIILQENITNKFVRHNVENMESDFIYIYNNWNKHLIAWRTILYQQYLQ